MAVSAKVDAGQLKVFQERLLGCLFASDINICSMAVDGAGKERAMLRHFDETAHRHRDQIIPYPPDPENSARAFNPHIPYIGPASNPRPVGLMEDPAHGRKTMWANFFSGGRYLTYGTHTAGYRNFYYAWQDGGPLWKRDVIKADRQSDNSARAIFSSANARWMHETCASENMASVVLITVLGRLIDAYENKTVAMEERIEAVLRAYYLIDIWKQFISSMGYSSQRHILSAQALDIINFLVVGFLQVHAILRDDYGGNYPFYPWLTGSTSCELTFGAARGVVKDFTALDWQYMVPKLTLKLRTLVSGREKASIVRSEGYNYDLAGNAAKLAPAARTAALNFVSHDRIIAISRTAYAQARSIASMLDVDVMLFEQNLSTVRLPSIVLAHVEELDKEDEDGCGDEGWDSDVESESSDDEGNTSLHLAQYTCSAFLGVSEEQLQKIMHWAADLDVSDGQREQLNKRLLQSNADMSVFLFRT